ncbi:MAG: hypothetical protein ACRDD7_05330 [Peptostreptococcaceae bacterium]
MDKKFINVALTIFTVSLIFIFGNKVIFKDLVHEEDATNVYQVDVEFSLHEKYEDDEGIKIKVKIDNPTKYTYRLEYANLLLIPIQSEEKGYEENTSLKIDLIYDFWNEKDINYIAKYEGIKPNSMGYIEFIIPKGIKLDSAYFELENIVVDYKGSFTAKIPFTNGGYITLGQIGGSTQLEGLSLNELDMN